MKHLKRIVSAVLIIMVFIADAVPVRAFNRSEHDEMMLSVLFYKNEVPKFKNDVSISDDINALECASYLSIDQYNGKGDNDLLFLKDIYGVKGLPHLKDIDYTSNAYHRRATHRGWDAEDYAVYNFKDNERWKIRKKILLDTTDKMFDFKGNETKHDSFCAIIYYTHILGDRIADEKYYSPNDIIELGGRSDKYDIAHELSIHVERLFSEQKKTRKYQRILVKLDSINSNISVLLKKDNGKLSDEDFKEYQKYANDLKNVLIWYIPEMLKEEEFFKEKFYHKKHDLIT